MLIVEDIKLLIEALDAWIEKPVLMGTMMSLITSGIHLKGENKEELIKKSMEKDRQTREERAEIATMLKAKLILIKQSILDLENKVKNTSIDFVRDEKKY